MGTVECEEKIIIIRIIYLYVKQKKNYIGY